MPPKFVLTVCIAVLLHTVSSIKISQFGQILGECETLLNIPALCDNYNPLDLKAEGTKVDPCSTDYLSSRICWSSFDTCVQLGTKEDDEVPPFCWACFVDSPAETQLYVKFQQCLENKVYGFHITGAALLLAVLAILIGL